jgi:hypothetical protein
MRRKRGPPWTREKKKNEGQTELSFIGCNQDSLVGICGCSNKGNVIFLMPPASLYGLSSGQNSSTKVDTPLKSVKEEGAIGGPEGYES